MLKIKIGDPILIKREFKLVGQFIYYYGMAALSRTFFVSFSFILFL